jgi:hypothetical protein
MRQTRSDTTSKRFGAAARRTSVIARRSICASRICVLTLYRAVLDLRIAWQKRRERQLEAQLSEPLDPDDQRLPLERGFFPGREAA